MSEHSNLPHDLPEYAPNWPVVKVVRARVYRACDGLWYWGHSCPRGGWAFPGSSFLTQKAAFAGALKHARGCW